MANTSFPFEATTSTSTTVSPASSNDGWLEEGKFGQASIFLVAIVPIMATVFILTFLIFVRCPWLSRAPSVYTRLRRVGLSPAQVNRHGGEPFHPLYIPRRPLSQRDLKK